MTLYASSPTLDGIKESIAKFYCTNPEKITINDDGSIINGSKNIKLMKVVKKKNRYRFEDVED